MFSDAVMRIHEDETETEKVTCVQKGVEHDVMNAGSALIAFVEIELKRY
jgi:hypothetical protein